MQFGIGILVGFALSVICLIRVETDCARHTLRGIFTKIHEYVMEMISELLEI